jgi:hypothetical protein
LTVRRRRPLCLRPKDNSKESETEATAREKRVQEFLNEDDDDDESTWSPPAKVKQAQEKKKKEELTQSQRTDRMTEAFINLLQVRRLIWSKAHMDRIDHIKVTKAWYEILASLQNQFAQKVLDESGMGSLAKVKTRCKTLRDAFNK